jgi:hypothetical protein
MAGLLDVARPAFERTPDLGLAFMGRPQQPEPRLREHGARLHRVEVTRAVLVGRAHALGNRCMGDGPGRAENQAREQPKHVVLEHLGKHEVGGHKDEDRKSG